jgi:hypothetical protein
MIILTEQLDLNRCPHCRTANPTLRKIYTTPTANYDQSFVRVWGVYICNSCGGLVTAWAFNSGEEVQDIYPFENEVDFSIPERPRTFLRQAKDSLHAPSGAVMLAASAVDAMLKEKGYKEGKLYPRIKKAYADHLLTEAMADWAHEVRLEANEERHADDEATMPDIQEAKRVIEFASALAEYLFVLPSKIEKARLGEK